MSLGIYPVCGFILAASGASARVHVGQHLLAYDDLSGCKNTHHVFYSLGHNEVSKTSW